MNTQQGNELTEFRTVRRILKKSLNGDVSKKTVVYCQHLLENYLQELCVKIVIQHQEVNTIREFHGLAKLKRYSVSTNINGVGDVFNPSSDWKVEGEVAKSVKPTTFSDKLDMEVA